MIFFTNEELQKALKKKKKIIIIIILSTFILVGLMIATMICRKYLTDIFALIIEIILTFILLSGLYFTIYSILEINRYILLINSMNARFENVTAKLIEIRDSHTINRHTFIELLVEKIDDKSKYRIFFPKEYTFNLELNKLYTFKLVSNIIKEYVNE